MLQTFRMVELGLSWRLDSTKEHSQRAFFSDDRSFGEFARLSKITLNIHHERCQRFNAYSTVNDCDFCDYTAFGLASPAYFSITPFGSASGLAHLWELMKREVLHTGIISYHLTNSIKAQKKLLLLSHLNAAW